VNPHLDFLLSAVYAGAGLHPEHLADLRRSGLTDQTVRLQRIRSVPPSMIDQLLGYHAPRVRSAYVIPFADPCGGWLDHVKLKVFGDEDASSLRGDHVEPAKRERWRYNGGQRKYLGRRAAPPRLFLPLATLDRALRGDEVLYLIEGEKKALAVAQLGLPAVGVESVWGWHQKGTRELLPDFDDVGLTGRVVDIVPDSDWKANAYVNRAVHCLADALRGRGARPRVVMVPPDFKGIDDYLVSHGHGA
jgi:hypothetical protein